MACRLNKKTIESIYGSILRKNQITELTKRTPKAEIKQREIEGKIYSYVSSEFIRFKLDVLFGFDWNFEVLTEHVFKNKEVAVKGRLTIRTNGATIVKEQFGGSDISLLLGDAFKAASTEALKKCASLIGICWDVYSKDPEPIKKEETQEAEKLTYPEQKVLDRLNSFLKKQTTIEGVNSFFKEFAEQREGDVLKCHEMARDKRISELKA